MRVCKNVEPSAPNLINLAHDERGQTAVEYVLLLAVIGMPAAYMLRTLLNVLSEYYRMIVFLETLPMP